MLQFLCSEHFTMKQVPILLLLVLNCDGAKIVKRFINEQNSTSDDSFQVNVSAGYGVHPDNNITTSSPSPVFIQERKSQRENNTMVQTHHQDQMSQASQIVKEIIPTPSYQVHEKSSEVQEKRYQVPKNHRYRSSEKKIRQRNNEIRKPVTEQQEFKDSVRHQHGKLAAGTKIVEVLRVPAMYELHLQSDPQRLVSLNSMMLNKLNSFMNQNQYKRPTMQPFYNVGVTRNLLPQASTQSLSYAQPFNTNNIPQQRYGNPVPLQNFRLKMLNPKPSESSQIKSSYGTSQLKTTIPLIQNSGAFKNNLIIPQSYQNYQLQPSTTKEPEKLHQEFSTQNPLNYRLLSNEISTDYYQKPQALHEVPAPVLNKQSYKPILPKIKSTSVPNLVYGKPIDSPYQVSTQSPVPAPGLWSSSIQEQGNQNGIPSNYQYDKGQVDPIRNYYSQQQSDKLNSYEAENTAATQYNQYHPKKSPFTEHNYKGHNNVQNYYNEAIGDSLDQSLSNVNGGFSTYLNNDGTMTVRNFHHNPKLYRPPPDYEIAASEEPNADDIGQDFNVGIMPYSSQQTDLANLNSQLYAAYSADASSTDNNQIETANNGGFGDHNAPDFSNLLLARSSAEETPIQYEPMNSFGRATAAKRMRQRPFSSNRRTEPLDYILYIKERILE